MEFPSRLGQCRNPQDLVEEQMRYWRTAYEQYSETVERMAELMVPVGAPSDETSKDEHDYITFPEAQERAPTRRARERKVA